MNSLPKDGETCLKPIGELTRSLVEVSFEDYAKFVVEMSKKQDKAQMVAIAEQHTHELRELLTTISNLNPHCLTLGQGMMNNLIGSAKYLLETKPS